MPLKVLMKYVPFLWIINSMDTVYCPVLVSLTRLKSANEVPLKILNTELDAEMEDDSATIHIST